jgi:hypothetical protein
LVFIFAGLERLYMWPFIVMVSLVGFAATVGRSRRPDALAWFLALVVLTIFVGLRHKVGMDWNNYLRMIDKAGRIQSFDQLLDVSEPLYALLLIWGDWTGFGIYAVNLVATLIFFVGLFRFARLAPEPWLALMAAIPFFVTVVAMSANRQALAAGVLIWLVADWYKLSVAKRLIWIFVAAGFHISALVYLAFVGMDLKVRLWIKVIALSVFALLVIYILQSTGHAEYYDGAYGRGQTEVTQSTGAWIHVLINAVPALFYFILPRYRSYLFPTRLSRQMALAAIATFPLVAVASVAAGRISLYWYPVSIWVWSAFPQIFSPRSRPLVRAMVSLAMCAMMVSWLLFANSSHAHLPYQNALFLEAWQLHIGFVP